jgi:hypothetical protein
LLLISAAQQRKKGRLIMKILKHTVVLAAVLMLMGTAAMADPISITPANAIASGNQTANPEILAHIFGIYGILDSLYKSEVGGGAEFGPFALYYDTSYVPPADPDSASIVWAGVPNPYITGSPLYLLVKDGNATPAWYLFDLNALGWDGKETLILSDFWPGTGAISHIEILGRTTVPEPTTLLLLGAGLLGVGILSRKLK